MIYINLYYNEIEISYRMEIEMKSRMFDLFKNFNKATITLQHWGVYSYGMIIRQQYIQWVTSDMVRERRVFKANKLP